MTREEIGEIVYNYGLALPEGPDYDHVMAAVDAYVDSYKEAMAVKALDAKSEAMDLRQEIRELRESNQRLLDIIIQKNGEIQRLKDGQEG